MKKDDCIFCKLANGQIPTNKIYEDEKFTVIMDAEPATKGHALILPKEHFDNLYELDDEYAREVLPLAKKIAAHMKDVLGCDGLNVVQNNGRVAGQTVFHFHTHIIPRYENGDAILSWSHVDLSDEEKAAICGSLQF